jgi:hypothetical protein
MSSLRLGVVFVLTTAVAACSNDVPPPPGGGTGGTGGTGGSGGSIGTGGAGGTAGTGGMTGAGGSGGLAGSGGVGGQDGMAGASGAGGIGSTGACTIADTTTLAPLDPNARQRATNCGLGPPCEGESDETAFSDCVTTCVELEVPTLSPECASCYGNYAWCSQACEDDCGTDSCSLACEICLSMAPNDQCIPELTQCTGRRMSLDCIDPT